MGYQYTESPGSYPVNITLKTLLKIANALKVDVSEFFDFEQEDQKKPR